ncbi:MAG: acetyl-CoA hydrolase/transferase family protein [Acidimicrobiales bacterium]
MGLGPAIPDALFTALGRRDDWEDLVLGGALLLNYYEVLTKPGVSFRSGFFGPAERILVAQGHRVEHVPGGFRQFEPILERLAPRVMIVQAAPPEGGRVNLALHYGATRAELLRAGTDPERLLVVEVNPHLPRTRTVAPEFDNTLPLEVVDVLVENDVPPFALTEAPADAIDTAIAGNVLRYVRDASTLQIGIGAAPNMVASELASGSLGNFGVHSEMFTTGLMQLHLAGKVTNTHKGIFTGRSVTTFALGTPELHGWLDDNDEVAFIDVSVLNDPHTISRNANFVSINGALCVDLYGQIVSDSIGEAQISGVGGHEDFVAGAETHLDSRSLICMRSTAEVGGKRVSRVMGLLPEGSVVSTPRHHTGVVVTEYGAAELMGLTVGERAHALVDIAHPDFRDELRDVAVRLGRR